MTRKSWSSLRGVRLCLWALGFLLGASLTASAHNPASNWYDPVWANDMTVPWRFVDNFPEGDGSRLRVREGADNWTQVGESALEFDFKSDDATNLGMGTCPEEYRNNKVGWGDFAPNGWDPDVEPLAIHEGCSQSGNKKSFRIKFNDDAPWYIGTEQPPNDKFDIWSVSSHEFGHAGGRSKGGDDHGHFPESWEVCDTPRHTMCPSLPPGTQGMRSLEDHDKDTFKEQY